MLAVLVVADYHEASAGLGSIFLDYRSRADFTDRKVILYGHNMKDGSMFSNLKKYRDADFRKVRGFEYSS